MSLPTQATLEQFDPIAAQWVTAFYAATRPSHAALLPLVTLSPWRRWRFNNAAITLGRSVWVAPHWWTQPYSTWDRATLLAHELRHVEQGERWGFASYMARAVGQTLLRLSYERTAFEQEAEQQEKVFIRWLKVTGRA